MSVTRFNAKVNNIVISEISEISDKSKKPASTKNTKSNTNFSPSINTTEQPENTKSMDNFEEIIESLEENQPETAGLTAAMKFLMSSMQTMMKKFDSLPDKVTAGQLENQEALEKIVKITTDLEEVRKENSLLKIELQKIKQEEVKNMVVVHGLPNEIDAFAAVKKLGDLLQVSIKDYHINDLYRIRPLDRNKHAPVVIKLNSYKIKSDLIFNRKGRSIYTSDIGLAGERAQIYINEYLTKEGMELFLDAKRLCKDCGFKYVWPKNGAIFAKKEDKSKRFQIFNKQQIVEIIQKNN
jgi:Baculovirus FP protein